MSTRRSVRSRTAAPPPVAPSQTPSSTPSIASGRAERQTRSQQPAPGNAQNAKRSESTEEYDGPGNKKSLRRTRASNQDDAVDHANDADEPAKLEPDGEDAGEEVTRCICGVTEYPGLVAENLDTYKQLYREGGGDDTAELVAEDIGSLFIQCDICKVWQHGGCVGIFDNALAPEEYFCELCRKDLHRLGTSSTGQRYSFYQPLRATLSMSPEPFRKPAREGRSRLGSGGLVPPLPTEPTMSAKKRSTMNSRDEEADIMRAIEESKKDGGIAPSNEASKSNKRSRSESDDPKSLKRQRTESETAQLKESNSSDEEQDEPHKKQSIRGAAARSQKQREQREARDKERQDAAQRRAARSERRRGESPTPSEVEEAAKVNSKDKAKEKTPPTQPEAATPSSRNTKKTPGGRKKGNRSGRNQYTRDKDKNQDDDDADDDRNEMDDSPVPDGKANGDTTGRLRGNATLGNGNEAFTNGGRGGTKSRHATAAANPSKSLLSECRKRAQAYREFLTQDGMDRRSALPRDAEVLQARKDNNESAPAWSNWTLAEGQAKMNTLTGKEVVSMLLGQLDGWIKEFGEPLK